MARPWLHRLKGVHDLSVNLSLDQENCGRLVSGIADQNGCRSSPILGHNPGDDIEVDPSVGERSFTDEPRRDGDVRVYAEADRKETASRAGFTTAGRAVEKYPWRWCHHSADLGIGGSRSATLFLDWGCGQLLWLNRCLSIVGRQTTTQPDFETTQRLAPDGTDRSGQAGTAMESAAGNTACQTIGTGPSKSSYLASGAKAGRLPVSCGQEWSAFPGRYTTSLHSRPREGKKKKASNARKRRLAAAVQSVRSVSDPPAGPRLIRDCAREFRLPIHTIVCFEAGRFALTQSSWTTLTQRCSRKWMSGHAAYALVLTADRGQFTTRKLYTSGEPILPSRGKSPLSLDSYLSWMSRGFVSDNAFAGPGPVFVRFRATRSWLVSGKPCSTMRWQL